MKDDRMSVQPIIKALLVSCTLFAVSTQCAFAGAIPYPNSGTLNPTTYTFTASNTGEVMAYFAGSTASFDNQLGMLINGVQSSSGFGLDNHSSAIGLEFDLGHVTKGDTLVFEMKNNTLGGLIVYSDPSMNSAYDNGGPGLNHIYSTAYTGSLGHNIPNGTYIGFEDLRGGGDKNYNDETFVFTNVASTLSSANAASVPEPSSIVVLGVGAVGCLLASAIRKRRQQIATGRIAMIMANYKS